MSDLITKKIKVKDAKNNMVLAQDIVSKTGSIIIPKNTELNSTHFHKLEDLNIKNILIYEKNEELPLEPQCIEDREEFKQFEKIYNQKIEKLENQFIAIGDGLGVDMDGLYGMVSDIVDGVTCKRDVLTYLHHIKHQDEYTYAHCLNVGLMCNLFGLWLGYDEEELHKLTISGLLHDVGKTQIDENIIKKPGKLTEDEYEYIKKHAYLGYNLVKDLDIPEEIKLGILMHHEKIDGSGYPLGLTENRITKMAKIVAICDIYEAMTAERSYRGKVCPFEVIRNFEQNSYDILDTQLLLAFLQNIAYTYIGSEVLLSDGRRGEVVFINQAHLSRPIVKSGDNFIDLSQHLDISIKEVL